MVIKMDSNASKFALFESCIQQSWGFKINTREWCQGGGHSQFSYVLMVQEFRMLALSRSTYDKICC